MTDATELLAQLRDVQTPPAPAQAPVWPALLAVLLLTTFAVTAFVIWYRRRLSGLNWYRTRLEKIRTYSSADQTTACAALLRSYAIGCSDASQQQATGQLTGDAWLQHLDTLLGTTFFSDGNGRVLGRSLYQPPQAIENGSDATSLIDAIDGLLRRQQRWRYRDRWRRLQQQVAAMPAAPTNTGQVLDAV